MLTDNTAYKCEIKYNKPFVIKQRWTNGTVTFLCGAINIKHNIRHIKPYTSDTNIEDINT